VFDISTRDAERFGVTDSTQTLKVFFGAHLKVINRHRSGRSNFGRSFTKPVVSSLNGADN
jgi:hypothetical protein